MPLTEFQSKTLRLLAVQRSPESFLAGGTVDGQNQPMTPDPAAPEFANLKRHFGSVRGAWPAIAK